MLLKWPTYFPRIVCIFPFYFHLLSERKTRNHWQLFGFFYRSHFHFFSNILIDNNNEWRKRKENCYWSQIHEVVKNISELGQTWTTHIKIGFNLFLHTFSREDRVPHEMASKTQRNSTHQIFGQVCYFFFFFRSNKIHAKINLQNEIINLKRKQK